MKLSFMTLGCPNWDLDTICRRGKEYGYDGVDFRGYLDTLDITLHPLFTIIQPRRVPDLVESMLAHHRETKLLPVWTLCANETNCMIGYHAVPVIADALLKGFTGFDQEEAYAAMKAKAR